MFKFIKIERPYKVEPVFKADGHKGQEYRFSTLKEAEEAKASMEKAWGAGLWDIVISKD